MPHNEVMVGEREHISLGFCLDWGQRWGPMISQVYSLLMDLKHNNRNLKLGKRKANSPNSQLLKFSNISKTKEPQLGKLVWLFIYACGWQCVYSRSLKQMLLRSECFSSQSLNQALALPKK